MKIPCSPSATARIEGRARLSKVPRGPDRATETDHGRWSLPSALRHGVKARSARETPGESRWRPSPPRERACQAPQISVLGTALSGTRTVRTSRRITPDWHPVLPVDPGGSVPLPVDGRQPWPRGSSSIAVCVVGGLRPNTGWRRPVEGGAGGCELALESTLKAVPVGLTARVASPIRGTVHRDASSRACRGRPAGTSAASATAWRPMPADAQLSPTSRKTRTTGHHPAAFPAQDAAASSHGS